MKRHRVHEGSFEEGHVWGCLVDRNNGRNVSHDERMVKTILRNHHSSRKKMFAPCFPANRSVFSQYFRNAGSGIYPLDAVRASSNVLSKSSIGNLISVLEKYVDMHTRMSREDWGFDTCLGAARSTLALLNQELAVIAVLFASKSWWVSEKKLFSVLGEDSEGECKLLDNLIRLEMVQFKPIGVDDAIAYVDSIDIEAENKATVNFFKMKKKESKLVVLVSCYKNERAAYEISEKYKSYRLCDSFYDQLAKCCSVVFAASYFTPEDAQNIFASKLLSSISLPEPPPILHCDVDRKMDKEFELRETFYLSVDLCSRLSESVMRGDHKSAQLALHESVCALEKLEIPDSNSFHNLTLPTARMLIIASLAGCHLLEREKRYADAEHYLQLLVNATQSSLHYSLLHADAVLRLARDLNHRKQSMTALQVVEKLLKQQGVAECVLWPANLCPNRLGGSGLAVIKLYLRLAVPPRRWRVSVPGVAKLKDPKSIRIHVEKGDSVENVVLKHFATTGGWKGMHAENGFTNTLFVLLFWDLLFNKEQWDCFHGFMELPPSVHDVSSGGIIHIVTSEIPFEGFLDSK